MKWLPTAGITALRFKIKTLTGKHELTGKKGKIMYKYDAKSLKAEEFINDEEIRETLAYADANKDNVELIDAIIAKARERKGLNHREASVLLACQIPEKIEEVYALAQQIKKDFYGNRIVLFAPLYLSNYCVNGCVYCPYHLKNKHIARKKLTQEEIVKEVTALQDMGHKRLAIEAGEDPVNNPIEYILECIQTIYSIKHKNGAIRRVNVNIAATTVENYRKLKDAVDRVDALQDILDRVIDRILAGLDGQTLMSHILQCNDLCTDFILRQLFTGNVLIFNVIRTIYTAVDTIV